MVLAIIAWLGAAVAVGFAWRASSDAVVDDGAARALATLRRHGPTETAPFDQSRAGQLCREAIAPETAEASIGELGITLSEVRRDVERARAIPSAAARIALALGTALALLEFARGLHASSSVAVGALWSFAGGVTGSVVSAMLGRRARASAGERERAWHELAATLARCFESQQGAGSGPRV